MNYLLTKNFLNEFFLDYTDRDELVKFYLKEKMEFFEITAIIPGFEKEELNIEINGDILTVSGEKKEEIDYLNLCSKFKKIFNLNDNRLNLDKIESNYKNGILKIVIFKKYEKSITNKITIS